MVFEVEVWMMMGIKTIYQSCAKSVIPRLCTTLKRTILKVKTYIRSMKTLLNQGFETIYNKKLLKINTVLTNNIKNKK